MRCEMRLASRTDWARLLESSGADYSVTDTYEFGEALARAYKEYSYQPCVCEFSDGVTMLLPLVRVKRRPGMLRCFEAMPLSLCGAPIAATGNLSGEHLSAALKSLDPDSIYINGGSVRRLPAGSWIQTWDLAIHDCVTHVLDISGGFEEAWTRSFSSKARNQCRAAERKGVEVVMARTAEDFDTYYSIYVSSARRWGYDSPPYPPELFRSLAELLGKSVELHLAKVDGQAVAGILLFRGRNTTLYWSGAMLKEFGSYNPNNALLRIAIEGACNRGEAYFDFGGSGRLDSVRIFKESFGARPVRYQNLVFATQRYRLMSRARAALAQMGI
jgi:CelD/BcsL family acetyltransferase involved in cellulose biosynthesis